MVRVNLRTGEMQPFFRTREGALGARGGYEYIVTPGLKRPVDVKFAPSGDALYTVDIGAIGAFPAGAGPFARAFPGTGVIWRIIREGTQVNGPPAGLSPLPAGDIHPAPSPMR